jgi:hypothetical protein
MLIGCLCPEASERRNVGTSELRNCRSHHHESTSEAYIHTVFKEHVIHAISPVHKIVLVPRLLSLQKLQMACFALRDRSTWILLREVDGNPGAASPANDTYLRLLIVIQTELSRGDRRAKIYLKHVRCITFEEVHGILSNYRERLR